MTFRIIIGKIILKTILPTKKDNKIKTLKSTAKKLRINNILQNNEIYYVVKNINQFTNFNHVLSNVEALLPNKLSLLLIIIRVHMQQEYRTFLDLLKAEFHEEDLTHWKCIDAWTSMQKLLIMNTINENYNIIIDHEDFKKAESLEHFYNITIKEHS
jgi:hypothetical protein